MISDLHFSYPYEGEEEEEEEEEEGDDQLTFQNPSALPKSLPFFAAENKGIYPQRTTAPTCLHRDLGHMIILPFNSPSNINSSGYTTSL